MLIQCHSCNTKYRLNLENIPKRKTFVRCKNCGTPIYIDPTEEAAAEGGVIPPPAGQDSPPAPPQPGTGESSKADGVQVVCPECDSRYRVESASLRRPGIKLKCTHCDAVFAPPQGHHEAAAGEDTPGLDAPEFYPPPSQDTDAEPAKPEMPVPDDKRVDSMFDDLRPDHDALQQHDETMAAAGGAPKENELGSLKGTEFENDPPIPDSERAYMEAVSFGSDGGNESLPSGGTVPDDQKFKFFLNPKDQDNGPAEDDSIELPALDVDSPEVPDDLPPLPAVVQDRRAEARREGGEEDRKEGGEEGGEEGREEGGEKTPEYRRHVPGQPEKFLTERRGLICLAAGALGILVGAGIWGWWLTASTQSQDPFSIQRGSVHQLSLPDNQKGHFVRNRPSGKRLFVINGKIENRFDNSNKVRWIRLKGSVYGDGGGEKPRALAFAYAGNLLKDGQLSKWPLADIQAYYGFNNGRENSNFEIPSGAKVPYQLVFTDTPRKVGKTVTEVISYYRGGESVFIDSP